MLKTLIRGMLDRAGLEVRRKRTHIVPPPPVEDHPIAALYLSRSRHPAAFEMPLDQCATVSGLGVGPCRWHNLTAVALEYCEQGKVEYKNSVLRRYFESWQPATAAQAVLGFDGAPEWMHAWPPHGFVPPWNSDTPQQRIDRLRRIMFEECREHGHRPLEIDTHGVVMFGPVSEEMGGFELQRCQKLLESLLINDYDRSHGDIRVAVLRRGKELLYLGEGGRHRRMVLAGLGYTSVPAVVAIPMIIDTQDVESWPQVRRGSWTADEALRYVDHLFEFNSRAWAARKGLTSDSSSEASQGH